MYSFCNVHTKSHIPIYTYIEGKVSRLLFTLAMHHVNWMLNKSIPAEVRDETRIILPRWILRHTTTNLYADNILFGSPGSVVLV